ncbi:hypothetical protein D3Y57_11855 [Sphingomonas paeninsulae]|uniref:Uncharacterized protein n=1 Tax=Sphingomonas paeninsulae TaxID=2319844 RepID=A0A494TAZ6_SPHPE|nr:hypothetical protein [Sphingomonas paeninsulae]AYJ86537.1 hypothetical protein D3Y57_11855 [Sphingomonas paeninsulae]
METHFVRHIVDEVNLANVTARNVSGLKHGKQVAFELRILTVQLFAFGFESQKPSSSPSTRSSKIDTAASINRIANHAFEMTLPSRRAKSARSIRFASA